MASLESWMEWKEKCALARCCEETRSQLLQFGWSRVMKTAWDECGSEMPPLTAEHAWHLIETHAIIPRSVKAGKFASYKDWLFGRQHTHGSGIDRIQGGASNLARDAARQHCAREARTRASKIVQSIDEEILGSDGTPVRRGDLLPSKLDGNEEVILRDFQNIALRETAILFESLSDRQCLILLVDYLELSANNENVQRVAACKRQALYEARDTVLDSIRKLLSGKYKNDGQTALFLLGTLIMRELQNFVVAKKRAEKWYEELFALLEDE